jgi:DNA-binding NarL/FixJ family response regulator
MAESPGARADDRAGERAITVVIADDQRMVRQGFRVILESEPGITVVAEAGDGREAIDLVRKHRPLVVLLDIRMPVMDGLTAARRVIADSPATRVLILTTYDADDYVYEALRAGVSGFLLKDAPADQLVTAVRCLAAGDALIDPVITRRLISRFALAAPGRTGLPDELRQLTARELEVLRLVARGLSNLEIAHELVVEENTVKTHVSRILMKLGLRDRVQAVVLAYESGFVTPDLRLGDHSRPRLRRPLRACAAAAQKGGGSSAAPGMVAKGSAGRAGPSSWPAQSPFSLGRVAQAGNGKSTASGTGMSGWAMNMVPGLARVARWRCAGGR